MTDLTILPTIRKAHQQRANISDSSAVRISSTDKNSQDGIVVESTCLVCHQNRARYTCPRCEIPYCSLHCYQSHGNGSGDKAKGGEGGCTEAFYQGRVANVLNLEAKEHKGETQRMLQNVHQQQNDAAEDAPEPLPAAYSLSQEELVRILKATEESSPDELRQLIASLSPQVQQSIDYAIQSGQVQEWVLEPWYPWWKPELVTKDDSGSADSKDVEEPQPGGESGAKTLDERLLDEVPPVSTLRATESGDLRFNLVDVLHATLSMLTLYHGVENASCHDNCFEAAQFLIQASNVLSRDARYTTLEQVLMDISNEGAKPIETCKVVVSVLSLDVASVCSNPRLAARALLEGKDILQSAMNLSKAVGDNESRSRFRRIRKKIEFILAWSREVDPHELEALGQSVNTWFAAWEREAALDQHTAGISVAEEERVLIQEVEG